MRKTLVTGLLLILAASPLVARDARIAITSGETDCRMNQTASLNINFNGTAEKAVDVREKMDEAIARVEKLAEKQGIKGMKIQSQNYSVNVNSSYNGGGDYQYSGNVQFTLTSSDKIFALMDTLKQERIMASLNVNEYREGACQ